MADTTAINLCIPNKDYVCVCVHSKFIQLKGEIENLAKILGKFNTLTQK